ncbi:asparagine synthase (glutamine-hydrolyzing) [Desulfocurvus sp. DL9XJH121]
MCGICGILGPGSHEPTRLDPMLGQLVRRGPDSCGTFAREGLLMGMRRLSINGLNNGDQPLFNEERSVIVVYNGEIYNYLELKAELEARGHRFRSDSDGEVICHLYEEQGPDIFDKLDGMFAVALWDEKRERLVLARDYPGEKPLYYGRGADSTLVFASEIKSLRRYPGVCDELDLQALWDFPTFLWIPEPRTAFKGVHALMPGTMLVIEGGQSRQQRYANGFAHHPAPRAQAQAIALTRQVITQSVASRLLSDVPVGCFLSGGLDSSIVSTLAARSLGQLDTFSIGFEDLDDPYGGSQDESSYARLVSQAIGSRHHEIRVTAKDFDELLETFCVAGDQPFAVSSGLGILAVAQRARQEGIKVLLSGDGADECFGGYAWYTSLARATGAGTREALPADRVVSYQNFSLGQEERLRTLADYRPRLRAWAWHYYAAEAEKKALFSEDLAGETISSLRHFDHPAGGETWKPNDFILHDKAFYLTNEMLRKVDRMTMAFSVESRVPFTAPAVLAFTDKLDFQYKVRDGELKWALREAFADDLPEAVVRRPKHGFNVPVDYWLKTGWNDLLRHSFSRESALHKAGYLHKDAAREAERMLNAPDRLNGHTLFCYIMLNLWLERGEEWRS